jgi:hypothetical protein
MYIAPEGGVFEDMQNAEQMALFGADAYKTISAETGGAYSPDRGFKKPKKDPYNKGATVSTVTPPQEGTPGSKSGLVMTPNGLMKVSSPDAKSSAGKMTSPGEARRVDESGESIPNPFLPPEVLERLKHSRGNLRQIL